MAAWLRLSNNNIIQLLHHLDVGNSEQKFKVSSVYDGIKPAPIALRPE